MPPVSATNGETTRVSRADGVNKGINQLLVLPIPVGNTTRSRESPAITCATARDCYGDPNRVYCPCSRCGALIVSIAYVVRIPNVCPLTVSIVWMGFVT